MVFEAETKMKLQMEWHIYIVIPLYLLLAVLCLGCDNTEPHSPIIFSMTAEPGMVSPGETSEITVVADDADDDELSYAWEASAGTVDGTGKTVTWVSPDAEGKYQVTVTVSDGANSVAETVMVRVSRNYYPLTVGNAWSFRDNNDNVIDFEIVDTINIEVLDVTAFVKRMTTSELEGAANFSYVARTSDGVCQYAMGGSNAGDDTITFSPELPIYRFPPTPGESWQVEFEVELEFGFSVGNGVAVYEVMSAEDLTVEAGSFENVFKIKEDFTWELFGDEIDHIVTYHWLAPDVGIVKFVQEETIGGQTIVTEATLKSYSLK